MGGTSFYDLIVQLQSYRFPLLVGMVLLPIVSRLGGEILKKSSRSAAAKFLSFPVFLAVVPGTCCALIIAYLLFFTKSNLLKDIDVILVAGPIICMIVTLISISKVLPFDEIPGFDRLSGLFITVSVSFLIVLILDRIQIRLWFLGSISTFFALFIVLFFILQYGFSKITGKSKE